MNVGKLIVFEGISGTGKETQAKLLQTYLQKKRIISHIVFHPTTEIKPLLKKQTTTKDTLRVLADDRKRKVSSVILPALSRGEWIISLRNFVSAYVYQGDGSVVEAVDVIPDMLFYFSITPEAAMVRVDARHKKTGEAYGTYETPQLLAQKRLAYEQILTRFPHVTIDASRDIESIHNDILAHI